MINDRSLLVVIDDFSDRVLDYDNVTLFDYGTFDSVYFIDNLIDIHTAITPDTIHLMISGTF